MNIALRTLIVVLFTIFTFIALGGPNTSLAGGIQGEALEVEGLRQMCDHASNAAPQLGTDFTTLVFSQILDAVDLTSVRFGNPVPKGSLLWSLKPWLAASHTARISMAKGSYLTLYYTLEDTKANSAGGYVRMNRFLTEEETKTICAPTATSTPMTSATPTAISTPTATVTITPTNTPTSTQNVLTYETLTAVCTSARQSREIWDWHFNAAFMERLVWALEFRPKVNPRFVRGRGMTTVDKIEAPGLYWTWEPWTTDRTSFQVMAYAADAQGNLIPGTLLGVFYVKKTTTAPAGGWYLPLERLLTEEEVDGCQFPKTATPSTPTATATATPTVINTSTPTAGLPQVEKVESTYNQVTVYGQNLWKEGDRPEDITLTFTRKSDSKVFQFKGGYQSRSHGFEIAGYWKEGITLRTGFLHYSFSGTAQVTTSRGRSNVLSFGINDPYCPTNIPSVASLLRGNDADWKSGNGQWEFETTQTKKLFVPYLGYFSSKEQGEGVPGTFVDTRSATFKCGIIPAYGSPTAYPVPTQGGFNQPTPSVTPYPVPSTVGQNMTSTKKSSFLPYTRT